MIPELDLAAPFRLSWWNEVAPPEHRLDGPAGALGVVAGNTGALWPRFLASARLDAPDPLDTWIAERVRAALPDGAWARLAHERPWPPIQRLAEVAGLARLSPARLAVHPGYGPWISLRAVIVVPDAPGPEARPPPLPDACAGCATRCVPLLERAIRAGPLEDAPDAWLAVRDACPVGRAHRFPEAMIRYGYTKDRAALRP